MKKTILSISIIALSITVKAQQLPKTVTINTADLLTLYNKIDTVNSILHESDLKGTDVTAIMNKIYSGLPPLNATIQRRIAFVADSLKKGAKK